MPTGKISYINVSSISKVLPSKRKEDRNEDPQSANNITYWNGLYIFGVLGGCALAISVQTLIPRHNAILQPSYWFEVNIPTGMGLFLMTTVMILECIILTEDDSFVSIHHFMRLYFFLFLSWIILYCTCCISWSIVLGHNHPMPFIGLICYFPTKLLSIGSFTILLSLHRLSENRFMEKQNFTIWKIRY